MCGTVWAAYYVALQKRDYLPERGIQASGETGTSSMCFNIRKEI